MAYNQIGHINAKPWLQKSTRNMFGSFRCTPYRHEQPKKNIPDKIVLTWVLSFLYENLM